MSVVPLIELCDVNQCYGQESPHAPGGVGGGPG